MSICRCDFCTEIIQEQDLINKYKKALNSINAELAPISCNPDEIYYKAELSMDHWITIKNALRILGEEIK